MHRLMRAQRLLRTGSRPAGERERGQILVLFALAAVAIIGMVGLVLDGGDTFAQRRDQQNVADVASLAGANAYLNAGGSVSNRRAAATAAASAAAARNGLTDGIAGTDIAVAVTLASSGAYVTVDVTRPHENAFARIMGFNSWPVSVTATAIAGTIDTAVGAAPWTMHVDAFNPDGTPKYTAANPQSFGEPPGPNVDFPVGSLDVAWTDFNGSNNVNANEVRQIIEGSNVVTATIEFEQYIGQHNSGMQTTIFRAIDTYLAGTDVPVPIVGPCPGDPSNQGCFKGWAMFHVVSASGGSAKTITGYFLSDFVRQPLTVGECTPAQQVAGTCGLVSQSPFGANVVRLTN